MAKELSTSNGIPSIANFEKIYNPTNFVADFEVVFFKHF